ncbi:MAG TPA: hypothetical protein DCF91_13255 [Porphyromonadaceae bacterium]|nr:hypothetical protein [Porphyromonadaceae bacterium]
MARNKVFAFVFEGGHKVTYARGIVHSVHDVSKSNTFVAKSNKYVRKSDMFVSKPDKNVPFCAQNKPEKKKVLVIETLHHENFIDG